MGLCTKHTFHFLLHCAGRSGSSVKYAPLLDALSAQVKQLHWEEASGLRQASVIPAHPSGNVQLPGSPTASQLYGMGSYQQNLRPHVFQPPAPGTWQGHPAVYPPQYSGVAAAAPDLADKEPFPYFMQVYFPFPQHVHQVVHSMFWLFSSIFSHPVST